jgi:succinate dehydrogenase / fumarate reductase cytochrome b subunit
MKWALAFFGSSIGKKSLMAVTGLGFIGFLVAHLAGNLTIYGGPGAFNSYAEHLHSLGFLLTLAEWGLLLLAAVHITTGLLLYLENLRSRPIRYKVDRRAGGRTLGSGTMPYTGLLILLFVVYHLLNFHFVDKSTTTIYQIVANTFTNPLHVGLYFVAMAVVAVHVSHGFWSLFQSLGVSHPKYSGPIEICGLALSVVFGVGFGFIPVYVALAV